MTKIERHREIKQQCIDYYQQAAAGYDSARFACECGALYDRLTKEVVYSYLKECEYILDAGTGTGRFAIYLAQKGMNIVAMDSSPEMIEIAREKARQAGCQDRIQFIVADIENLPFKDSSFYGVCSIIVLIHLTCPDYAVSELLRVLKPGGVSVIDVPNKLLSGGYGALMNLIGRTTFQDYHYNLRNIKSLFLDNSVKVVEQRKFGKLPRSIIHLFLCVLNSKFLQGVIERFEKFNFGGTSIIKGLKFE
ncbi:class I SAM-dependent methyltransferase [Chloroflexota bacterium]